MPGSPTLTLWFTETSETWPVKGMGWRFVLFGPTNPAILHSLSFQRRDESIPFIYSIFPAHFPSPWAPCFLILDSRTLPAAGTLCIQAQFTEIVSEALPASWVGFMTSLHFI